MFALILFLDIDGVLNHRKSAERFGTFQRLDPACVQILKAIVEEHGFQIILSSTWRFGRDWRERVLKAFAAAGWGDPPIIGRTSLFDGDETRGEEIHLWLESHPVERFVIIDDDSDMLERQLPFFVQTVMDRGGLTERHKTQVREILSR